MRGMRRPWRSITIKLSIERIFITKWWGGREREVAIVSDTRENYLKVDVCRVVVVGSCWLLFGVLQSSHQQDYSSSSSWPYSWTGYSRSAPRKIYGCLILMCWFREPSDLSRVLPTHTTLCNLKFGTCSVALCPQLPALFAASFRPIAHYGPPTALQPFSEWEVGYL